MASSASELADLAQKHQDNKQKDNSARSREGIQQNTSTNNAETQDPPCQDPGDRFFPSCASVALARSSHLVVLMNELRKCIHCIPLWGFKSGAKSLQSGASSKTKNQQRHNKKQTPTTHTPNNTNQKQNAKGTWHDGSKKQWHQVLPN